MSSLHNYGYAYQVSAPPSYQDLNQPALPPPPNSLPPPPSSFPPPPPPHPSHHPPLPSHLPPPSSSSAMFASLSQQHQQPPQGPPHPLLPPEQPLHSTYSSPSPSPSSSSSSSTITTAPPSMATMHPANRRPPSYPYHPYPSYQYQNFKYQQNYQPQYYQDPATGVTAYTLQQPQLHWKSSPQDPASPHPASLPPTPQGPAAPSAQLPEAAATAAAAAAYSIQYGQFIDPVQNQSSPAIPQVQWATPAASTPASTSLQPPASASSSTIIHQQVSEQASSTSSSNSISMTSPTSPLNGASFPQSQRQPSMVPPQEQQYIQINSSNPDLPLTSTAVSSSAPSSSIYPPQASQPPIQNIQPIQPISASPQYPPQSSHPTSHSISPITSPHIEQGPQQPITPQLPQTQQFPNNPIISVPVSVPTAVTTTTLSAPPPPSIVPAIPSSSPLAHFTSNLPPDTPTSQPASSAVMISPYRVVSEASSPPNSCDSLYQMFEATPLDKPHMLYCKKCALFKPAVEFASTTGFFNNNCKHCRNYRRKGEDSKSEAVQELYRISTYDQLRSTLAECLRVRRGRGGSATLICIHFYLESSFIANPDRTSSSSSLGLSQINPPDLKIEKEEDYSCVSSNTQLGSTIYQNGDRIDAEQYLTSEGRSVLANRLVREVKLVDGYSYNHRSTRLFKSGETHKYLCSQSTALPWRQKKKNAAVAAAAAAAAAAASTTSTPVVDGAEVLMNCDAGDQINSSAIKKSLDNNDPEVHNCSGTVLVKFKSPGTKNQRVCVAYCHDVSHAPKSQK